MILNISKNTKQTWIDQETLFNLPRRNVTKFRVSLHILFWCYDFFTAHNALDRVLRVAPTVPPDPVLLDLMLYTHIGTTVLLFYCYGYLVVPSLMTLLVYNRATGRWLWRKLAFVIAASISVYVLFNIYDYYLYIYAYSHFKPAPAYVIRFHDLLLSSGPFGIFVNYSLFTFIWAYNVSYLMLPLLIRIIREAISWGVEGVSQKEQNKELINNQLRLLQQQINPHFLFNVFNNIYALIQKTNEQAATLLRGLSELMHYTLYKTNQDYVPFMGELNFLKNYINIEKSRQFNPDRISYQIIGETANYLVPPLLLVTFVENAFKHGLNNAFEEGYVRVTIDIQSMTSSLKMKVVNFVSSEEKINSSDGGVGLLNAQKRLELLFGKDNYSLLIKHDTAVYDVEL